MSALGSSILEIGFKATIVLDDDSLDNCSCRAVFKGGCDSVVEKAVSGGRCPA